MPNTQIGVLSCSGEEFLGGTLARMATRKVMELRPDVTVTLCLPLYIAGGEEERAFAKEYPVIAVEGCNQCCSTCATEKFSGKVHDTIIIADLIGEETALQHIVSARDITPEHEAMADAIAQKICESMDRIEP